VNVRSCTPWPSHGHTPEVSSSGIHLQISVPLPVRIHVALSRLDLVESTVSDIGAAQTSRKSTGSAQASADAAPVANDACVDAGATARTGCIDACNATGRSALRRVIIRLRPSNALGLVRFSIPATSVLE
jgi:hypothetical protein